MLLPSGPCCTPGTPGCRVQSAGPPLVTPRLLRTRKLSTRPGTARQQLLIFHPNKFQTNYLTPDKQTTLLDKKFPDALIVSCILSRSIGSSNSLGPKYIYLQLMKDTRAHGE